MVPYILGILTFFFEGYMGAAPKVCLQNDSLCYYGSYKCTQSGEVYESFQGETQNLSSSNRFKQIQF